MFCKINLCLVKIYPLMRSDGRDGKYGVRCVCRRTRLLRVAFIMITAGVDASWMRGCSALRLAANQIWFAANHLSESASASGFWIPFMATQPHFYWSGRWIRASNLAFSEAVLQVPNRKSCNTFSSEIEGLFVISPPKKIYFKISPSKFKFTKIIISLSRGRHVDRLGC